MIISQRLYFVPHSWSHLAVATLGAVVIVLLGAQINLVLWADIIIKSTLISIALIGFIVIGLVETKELARMRLWLSHVLVTNRVKV